MLGRDGAHLGRSALLQTVFNRDEGDAPFVDLDEEDRNGRFIRTHSAWIKACTDISDGGLALAAFEMAHAGEIGVQLDRDDTAFLFGEDQGRYLIACNFDQAEGLMIEAGKANLVIQTVGRFTGSDVKFGTRSMELNSLSSMYQNRFNEVFD